jgi:cell division protein FtsQ
MRWLSRPPADARPKRQDAKGRAPGNSKGGAAKGVPARRRPRPRLQRAALLWGPVGILAVAIVAGGWWLTASGRTARLALEAEHQLIEAARSANLTLRKIQVEGRRETPTEAILAAVQVVNGDPILAAEPAVIKRRLERLAWVKSASVERRLPDTLYLRIEEQQPMAIWQRDRKLVLISRTAEEIEAPRPADFDRYLVVVGDDAPANTASLLEMLGKAPELVGRVTAAVRVGARRWNLRMDNGVEVNLPEENALAAWLKLARLQRQEGLLERDLIAIDLRLPDRLVMRLTPDAAKLYHAPKDNT